MCFALKFKLIVIMWFCQCSVGLIWKPDPNLYGLSFWLKPLQKASAFNNSPCCARAIIETSAFCLGINENVSHKRWGQGFKWPTEHFQNHIIVILMSNRHTLNIKNISSANLAESGESRKKIHFTCPSV